MTELTPVVAVFTDHQEAEAAITNLASGGIPLKNLSIAGKGYHATEKVVGFYNFGDRIKIWGSRGAIWGGLWSLFLSGVFITAPVVGSVVVIGYLAVALITVLEGAVVGGGLGALGAALYGIGIPKDSILIYEEALGADQFLVMAHGSVEEMERAKTILKAFNPLRIDQHIMDTDRIALEVAELKAG
jgi:hypothetical protein